MEIDGGGTPLIMIHGLGCASSYEYPDVALSPALRERHVILIDLLGFGYSDHPVDFGYRMEDHAEVVAQFIEAVSLDRIDLYGHSMGGSVAVEVAHRLQSRIGNLVLSEANLDSGGGQFSRNIAASNEADYVRHVHVETVADALAAGNCDWAATMRLCSPLAVHRGARSLVEGVEPSWRDRFYQHPAHRAFIFGERSLPDPDVAVLGARGIQVLIVKNSGHSMGLENPTELASAIAEAIS
ncbi:alpha/beta hydrolase [Mesorhizobium sp.]|uniref:alpha/beta fold hydrolase n=1 Tax=Mesorhizobium sp. TaxID=1871066 RepID=UPI002600324E|nr:alpha/beta hydrolase [Mesorhizobium sp.]